MRRVFLGVLSLMVLLALSAPAALAARSHVSGKTIKDLSADIPLALLERSVGGKFYQSLLRSPIDDWTIVEARVTGTRLSRARVIRGSKNPAYNSLALKFANQLTLVANDPSENARRADSARMHLLIYQIADGLMAVSFGYTETHARQPMKNSGTVRLSVKTREGAWTEIRPLESRQDKMGSLRERGSRLRRMDRMPMDVISIPSR
jgi:hypothetical protein